MLSISDKAVSSILQLDPFKARNRNFGILESGSGLLLRLHQLCLSIVPIKGLHRVTSVIQSSEVGGVSALRWAD